ncbi:MAG: SGNH/GDSL hydrolase family protein [Pirellulales bacterium]
MPRPTKILFLCLLLTVVSVPGFTQAAVETSADQWNGYERIKFKVESGNAFVIQPKKALEGNPWIWRARFFGHEPQADLALLDLGYHVGYCEVGNLFGAPVAVQRWDKFYEIATSEFSLSKKVALEGMSRGGLIIYTWAIANPEKVACIYGDNPVLDIRSWPAGKWKGKGHEPTWKNCLAAYNLTEETLASYSPVYEHLKGLAEHKVPLLHIAGTADTVVPVAENTDLLEKNYQQLGGQITVIRKEGLGHHPHSLKNPQPIVRFVLKNTGHSDIADTLNFEVRNTFINSRIKFEREKKGTVAFIGGSITEMPGYRPMVCKWLQSRFPDTEFTFVAAGISSTCSTTGAMRLERDVLSHGPIDLFFVEYAVNDDQDAMHARRECIRGMEGIINHVRTSSPLTDMVVTHFVNPSMLATLQKGQVPLTIEAHTSVCEAYGVTTNNLANEVADQITAGELTWEVFGGTHPKPPGNQVCADMIANFLGTSWDAPLAKDAKPEPHALPSETIDPNSYSQGRFIDINQAKVSSGWEVKTPKWSDIPGGKRDRYTSLPMIVATEPGSSLKLDFTGSAIGAFIVAGPDAGQLEASIDGGDFSTIETFHRYSKGLHYPRTVMFAADLTSGKHQLELRVSKQTNSKGTAIRIMEFTGN